MTESEIKISITISKDLESKENKDKIIKLLKTQFDFFVENYNKKFS